jgi:hypothetical protein
MLPLQHHLLERDLKVRAEEHTVRVHPPWLGARNFDCTNAAAAAELERRGELKHGDWALSDHALDDSFPEAVSGIAAANTVVNIAIVSVAMDVCMVVASGTEVAAVAAVVVVAAAW